MHYSIKKYTADITVEEYTKSYVDVNKFLSYCKACPNYDKKWSCPSYDFDVNKYWSDYTNLHIIGLKIIFDEKNRLTAYSQKEIYAIIKKTVYEERVKLDKEILKLEKDLNGKGLYAGSCNICGSIPCKRLIGEECRYPDKMRYSLESLGADISKTTDELLGVELKWAQNNKLPEYFTLVCGVLY